MADVVTIEAETRARAGKGAARATRREGKVPGVIYGGRQDPNLIALEPREVMRELQRAGWQSRLYELQTGGESVRALIRAVQFHPVTDKPLHVDFQRLIAGERVKVRVPVHFANDGISPGLKRGGVLNVVRHAVEVFCQSDNIPDQFTADLGPLDFNDNIRWADLSGTEGVTPAINRDFVIATVVAPTKVEEGAAATVIAAPAAAAAPVAPAKAPARAPAKRG